MYSVVLVSGVHTYIHMCIYICVLCLVAQACPTLCDPLDCSPPGSSVHGDSPGKNTGVGCHALLQGIFATQGLNPSLPHCRWILYQLSHQGSPRILEWVAYPFSRGSSQPRNRSGVSCLTGESLPAEPAGTPWQPFLTRSLFVMFAPPREVCPTACRRRQCVRSGVTALCNRAASSRSVASCCGAWLPALPTEQTCSTSASSGPSS